MQFGMMQMQVLRFDMKHAGALLYWNILITYYDYISFSRFGRLLCWVFRGCCFMAHLLAGLIFIEYILLEEIVT